MYKVPRYNSKAKKRTQTLPSASSIHQLLTVLRGFRGGTGHHKGEARQFISSSKASPTVSIQEADYITHHLLAIVRLADPDPITLGPFPPYTRPLYESFESETNQTLSSTLVSSSRPFRWPRIRWARTREDSQIEMARSTPISCLVVLGTDT